MRPKGNPHPVISHEELKYKVFGVGLSFTGVACLDAALQRAGYRTLTGDPACIPFLSPYPATYSFARYSDYDAVLDIPTALYYEQMMEIYPDSRFILTVRDEQAWVRDMHTYLDELRSYYRDSLPFRIKALLMTAYGSLTDESVWLQHYRAHNKAVQHKIPKERLLIMDDAALSWSALCGFLERSTGVCSPGISSIPFPNLASGVQPPERHQAHYFPELFTSPWLNEKQFTLAYQAGASADAEGSIVARPWQPSRFAYVALLSIRPGKDGLNAASNPYFLDCIIALHAVRDSGSTHDRVVMLLGEIDPMGLHILQDEGIRVVSVGHVASHSDSIRDHMHPASAAVYRAKLRILQLVEYERVVFIDTDLIVSESAEYLFHLPYVFVGQPGRLSPFNAGMFMVQPSLQAYSDVEDVAASHNFNQQLGWMEYGPVNKHDGTTIDWRFYGSTVDQGLLYFYFACHLPANSSLLSPSVLPQHAHFVKQMKVHDAPSLQFYLSRPAHLLEGVWGYLRALSRLTLHYPQLHVIGDPVLKKLSDVTDHTNSMCMLHSSLCRFMNHSVLSAAMLSAPIIVSIDRLGTLLSLLPGLLWRCCPPRPQLLALSPCAA